MTIDRYRLNWRAIKDRKEAIDEHLAEFRNTAKPMINVDALVFVLVVFAATAVISFLSGYSKGYEDAKAEPRRTEYVSPATKCTSWDVVGNQKRCMTWKRVL